MTSTNLIGVWNRIRASESDEDVMLQFAATGDLTYTINANEKLQVIRLRYFIDGNILVTDQPSAPRIERTRFSLEDADTLALEYQDEQSRFQRKHI